jgi:predicted RNase H-like nuclease (RuvC/YqgF family)
VKKSKIIRELNNKIEFLQKNISEINIKENLKKKEAYNLLMYKFKNNEPLEYFGSYVYVVKFEKKSSLYIDENCMEFSLSNGSIIIIRGFIL